MILRIQHRFISAVAATAIAITGIGALPARAGNDDAARALALILGLAAISHVVSGRYDNSGARSRVYREPKYYQPRPTTDLRPLPKRVSRKLLPQQCLRSFETDRGRARLFSKPCLKRNYKHVRKLPESCERRVWTERGWRTGYGARCLSRQGYQLARR